MRKICVITGTRAEFGIFLPILNLIESSSHLKLYLIATGMHLMKEFGYTAEEIEKSGINISQQIEIGANEDTGKAMANSVGKAVLGLADYFEQIRPDIVVTLGDRGEMLAAATAANYMNISIAHIHGGEVSGHVDGLIRHAITKLAHIHFPATVESKERIIKMGEEPWRVFMVGAPALDRILSEQVPTKAKLFKKFDLDISQPLMLLVQHPVSIHSNNAANQIRATLEAIKEIKLLTIVIYPNSDAGGRKMIGIIEKYEKENTFVRSLKSVSHQDYLGLMKYASVLIGNSSSGIIEAPSFKLPVVNIGIRQKGRERSTNIIDVPHNKDLIIKAIRKALYDKKFCEQVKKCKNPYGDGHASERIVEVLSTIKLGKKLLQKQLMY